MKLPKVATPFYTTELPSTGKKIKYRPFLIKEEKLLLIAAEEKDTNLIVQNLNKVLKNCIATKDIDVEKLTAYDTQWLFLKLREVSIGNIINAKVKCPITQKYFETDLNLKDVKVIKKETRQNKIVFDAGVGVVLKDLTLADIYEHANAETDQFTTTLNILAKSIVEIFDGENSYPAEEATQEELIEFLENLQKEHFEKINSYFESMPKIRLEVELFSPHAAQQVKLVLENFMDFFA